MRAPLAQAAGPVPGGKQSPAPRVRRAHPPGRTPRLPPAAGTRQHRRRRGSWPPARPPARHSARCIACVRASTAVQWPRKRQPSRWRHPRQRPFRRPTAYRRRGRRAITSSRAPGGREASGGGGAAAVARAHPPPPPTAPRPLPPRPPAATTCLWTRSRTTRWSRTARCAGGGRGRGRGRPGARAALPPPLLRRCPPPPPRAPAPAPPCAARGAGGAGGAGARAAAALPPPPARRRRPYPPPRPPQRDQETKGEGVGFMFTSCFALCGFGGTKPPQEPAATAERHYSLPPATQWSTSSRTRSPSRRASPPAPTQRTHAAHFLALRRWQSVLFENFDPPLLLAESASPLSLHLTAPTHAQV